MPGENLQDWSTTAATNSTADSSINWSEGQPRASVNNSARSMMAAHAKDRNLKNGSITTGGTANAQTFTSGVTYTSVPTGLWVRLKAGATNTGAVTLNMDGIGAVTVLDQYGNTPGAGALVTGQYIELLYNGTNWILLRQNASGTVPHCGRLTLVGPTALRFLPFNGDQIKINGIIYSIPSSGIVGLSNTGVYLDGTAGQNLLAGGQYLVYAFVNGGVLTADFRTLGTNPGHSASATTGNIGVEIMQGFDTLTLLGFVKMNSSAQFVDSLQQRFVISWFNRRNRVLSGFSTAGTTTTATALTEINSTCRIEFVCWGDDEHITAGLSGAVFADTIGAITSVTVGVDGATQINAQGNQVTAAGVSYQNAVGMFATTALTEAYHFLTPIGATTAASISAFFVVASALIRG